MYQLVQTKDKTLLSWKQRRYSVIIGQILPLLNFDQLRAEPVSCHQLPGQGAQINWKHPAHLMSGFDFSKQVPITKYFIDLQDETIQDETRRDKTRVLFSIVILAWRKVHDEPYCVVTPPIFEFLRYIYTYYLRNFSTQFSEKKHIQRVRVNINRIYCTI